MNLDKGLGFPILITTNLILCANVIVAWLLKETQYITLLSYQKQVVGYQMDDEIISSFTTQKFIASNQKWVYNKKNDS